MRLPLIAAILILSGCSRLMPGGSGPGPTADPVAALVSRLQGTVANVHAGGAFDGSLLSGRGAIVCVDGESIQVYAYDTNADRDRSVGTIDADDPSHIGTSIVEWIGKPRFWIADRAIVQYVGGDSDVVDLLTAAIDEPFAEGHGMARQTSSSQCP